MPKFTCLLYLCLSLLSIPGLAQNKDVTGKVTNTKDGTPLQGATVSVKGSNTATQTNANGTFTLSVPASASTLIISSVDFASQEVDISNKSSVDVSLAASNATLTDVVVIGYATVRKTDVTSSVSKVTERSLIKGLFKASTN